MLHMPESVRIAAHTFFLLFPILSVVFHTIVFLEKKIRVWVGGGRRKPDP